MQQKPTKAKAAHIAETLINGNTGDAARAHKGYSGMGGALQALFVAEQLCPALEQHDGFQTLVTALAIRLPWTGFVD